MAVTTPEHDVLKNLQWDLERSRSATWWYWEECQRLEAKLKEYQHLEAEFLTPKWVRISSPLTKNDLYVQKPTERGYHWSWYEASCPCCKRPLDVTLVRNDTPAKSNVDITEGNQSYVVNDGGVSGGNVRQGTPLRVMGLPPQSEELALWKTPHIFEKIGMLKLGRTLVANGPVEIVNGCPMVPVQPEGAIDCRYVEVVNEASTIPPLDPLKPTAPRKLRYAYCAVIWGANAGYTLGALVLGSKLKELGAEKMQTDLVLLHTDDVPMNFVEALAKVWTVVRQVEYIDGVETMYLRKGGCFDGVFTKLAAWSLTEYDKVLLMDVDLIPLQLPEPIFDVEAPAAFVRGNGQEPHGCKVDGRRFFVGDLDEEHRDKYAWSQSGGINAGVILLQPCQKTLQQMLAELGSIWHPEHLPSPGPEQDYLTRFFASKPWHALDVKWNYQIHHVPFALQHILEWRRFALSTRTALSAEDHQWQPRRLSLSLEDIGIVHFSGDVKLWHICLQSLNADENKRRAVDHAPLDKWADTNIFVEYLLRDSCEGYTRWVERRGQQEEYNAFGCTLKHDGHVIQQVGDACEDVTHLVDSMVEHLRAITRLATETWRQCAKNLFIQIPTILEDLREPQVAPGSFSPGTQVEVQWSPPGRLQELWLPACVMSVHRDGRHVVRFERGGDWGDTERGVELERVRQRLRTQDDNVDEAPPLDFALPPSQR